MNDWYDATAPAIRGLSQTLTELADRNVDPELPDISKSLELLKERLAGRTTNSGNNDGNGNSNGGEQS